MIRNLRKKTRLLLCRTTAYIDTHSSWFDFKSHKKLLNMNVFAKINEAIGPAGLVGLDKLYSHMIKTDLESLIASLQQNILNEKSSIDVLNAFHNETASTTKTIHQPLKFYNNYVSKFVKNSSKVFDFILKIGQKQIIRKYIASELSSSCKFNSKNLESSLRTMNE